MQDDVIKNRKVVSTREANLYHDSYFYAVFWNEDKAGTYDEFSEEMIGSTAFAGGYYNLPLTASQEAIDRYFNEYLPRKIRYDNSISPAIQPGDKVYNPRARKYKGIGIVKAIVKDRYSFNSYKLVVEFDEGVATLSAESMHKFIEFINGF